MTLDDDFECNKTELESLLSTMKLMETIISSYNDLTYSSLYGLIDLNIPGCFTSLDSYWRNRILETSESDEESTYFKEIYNNYTECTIN